MSLKESTDEMLLSALKGGGRDEFTEIYKRYWSDLFNSVYKRTRNRELCQDIIQNVFADLWLRRNHIEISNLPAYLHSAVRFQLYKQIARTPKHSVYLDEFEEIISSSIGADSKLHEKEMWDLVNLWIAALPERRREIFLMHYMDEVSTQNIAEKLGVSRNTVQAQLYTAGQRLRAQLAQFTSLFIVIGVFISLFR